MSIASLVFQESENQLIAGFPETVSIFSSNPAAIIYFTTDGSIPDPFSQVYTEAIRLPTDSEPFTLSAIAYANIDGYMVPGSVLSYTWSLDNTAYFEQRKSHKAGVAYIYPGGLDIPYWYDFEGNTSTYLDVDPVDILFLISDRDSQGFPQPSDYHNEVTGLANTDMSYLSTLAADNFNPEASVIIIDTRPESVRKPSVTVINGPYMTLRDPDKYYRGIDYRAVDSSNHTSGQHIQSYYNRNTGTHVAYYFDTVDAKWIKSISHVPVEPDKVRPLPVYQHPLVYQWNLFGRYNTF